MDRSPEERRRSGSSVPRGRRPDAGGAAMPGMNARRRWLPPAAGPLPLRRAELLPDVVAGVTLASLAIPEVLGYARIAGMPVATGLYTLLVPVVVFALLGSSRHLVAGRAVAGAVLAAAVRAAVPSAMPAADARGASCRAAASGSSSRAPTSNYPPVCGCRPLASRSAGSWAANACCEPPKSCATVSALRRRRSRTSRRSACWPRRTSSVSACPVCARNAAHVTRSADTRGALHRAGRAVRRCSARSSSAGGVA